MAKPSLWATALWAKSESEKLAQTWPMGSVLESRVLRTWQRNSPRMVRSLNRWQATEALAHVLVDRFVQAEVKNIKAGLPPCDAREEAEKDWLMLNRRRTTTAPCLAGFVDSGSSGSLWRCLRALAHRLVMSRS